MYNRKWTATIRAQQHIKPSICWIGHLVLSSHFPHLHSVFLEIPMMGFQLVWSRQHWILGVAPTTVTVPSAIQPNCTQQFHLHQKAKHHCYIPIASIWTMTARTEHLSYIWFHIHNVNAPKTQMCIWYKWLKTWSPPKGILTDSYLILRIF